MTNMVNIEKTVLATILFNESMSVDEREELFNSLNKKDFSHPEFSQIFDIAKKLIKDEKIFDENSILMELKRRKIDLNIEIQYQTILLELLTITPVANLTPYLLELKNNSKKTKLKILSMELLQNINDNIDFDITKYIRELENINSTDTVEIAKKLNLKKIRELEREPQIEFVLDGFEKSSIGILTGAGSTGKGFFSLQLLCSVADTTMQKNFCNLVVLKGRGKVGFLTAEDSDDILTNRLYKILNSDFNEDSLKSIYENLDVKSVVGENVLLYSRDKSDIARVNYWQNFLLNFCKGKNLVILDTMRRFYNGEENSSGDISEFLKSVEYIAKKTNCSILLTHHTNKGASGESNDEASNARGSSAITDNARYQIAIAKMSKNQAKDYDVKEEQRSYYVQVDVPKINYSMPIEKKWLVRMDGGVLVEKFGGFEKANIDKTPQTKPQKLNENKTYSEDEVF